MNIKGNTNWNTFLVDQTEVVSSANTKGNTNFG